MLMIKSEFFFPKIVIFQELSLFKVTRGYMLQRQEKISSEFDDRFQNHNIFLIVTQIKVKSDNGVN